MPLSPTNPIENVSLEDPLTPTSAAPVLMMSPKPDETSIRTSPILRMSPEPTETRNPLSPSQIFRP